MSDSKPRCTVLNLASSKLGVLYDSISFSREEKISRSMADTERTFKAFSKAQRWHSFCRVSHISKREKDEIMQVRDAVDVIANWPPAWMGTRGHRLAGEVGVLESAYSNNAAETVIFAEIRVGAERFIGAIFLSDVSRRTRILTLLQANVGRSIEEIGSLEL